MSRTTRRRLLWTGAIFGLFLLGLVVAGYVLAQRAEPYLREQTVAFLEKRFQCRAELQDFRVTVPPRAVLAGLFRRRGAEKLNIQLRGLVLRFSDDLPPLIAFERAAFQIDAAALQEDPIRLPLIRLEGLQIHLPPKGSRPKIAGGGGAPGKRVLIERIESKSTRLAMLPKDPTRRPLIFEIHDLLLTGVGPGAPMRYTAKLTNAKPPGLIDCTGSFGPWHGEDPGATPLDGEYTFANADLGVFKGIAGTLSSKGSFSGVLQELIVDGETTTPDFRLTGSGNRVPLTTRYHAIVDGTNGNTHLEPVHATLGATRFTVKGAVARYKDDTGKTVDLEADMPAGRLDDVLFLAMKGPKPFLRGGIRLKTRVLIPPGKAHIADKLRLAGNFQLTDARFTSTKIQEELDKLARRAEGRPTDESIDHVPVQMRGAFRMGDGRIDFSALEFAVPGALIDLTGGYAFHKDELGFRGTARLQARVSQLMVSKWKRWALKPVDPFFAKQGYGTVAKIKIEGSREKPKFGLDR